MEKEFTRGLLWRRKGKTTLAIGQCLRASAQGKSVINYSVSEGKRAQENWTFWKNWIIWISRYSVS